MKYHYQVGRVKGPWSIKYYTGDEYWKSSIHIEWNWRGRAHWLCVFLPEVFK